MLRAKGQRRSQRERSARRDDNVPIFEDPVDLEFGAARERWVLVRKPSKYSSTRRSWLVPVVMLRSDLSGVHTG
jgi:hypothetical protein